VEGRELSIDLQLYQLLAQARLILFRMLARWRFPVMLPVRAIRRQYFLLGYHSCEIPFNLPSIWLLA
jgi:hypothetical protein